MRDDARFVAIEREIAATMKPGQRFGALDSTFMLVETTSGDDGEPVTTIEHLASLTSWKVSAACRSNPWLRIS